MQLLGEAILLRNCIQIMVVRVVSKHEPPIVQEISNRTHWIAVAPSLGVRWEGPIQFLMDIGVEFGKKKRLNTSKPRCHFAVEGDCWFVSKGEIFLEWLGDSWDSWCGMTEMYYCIYCSIAPSNSILPPAKDVLLLMLIFFCLFQKSLMSFSSKGHRPDVAKDFLMSTFPWKWRKRLTSCLKGW